MSAPELLPGVPIDLPPDQDPTALAIFFHGLGDLPDGPMGTAIARLFPAEGIAVARLPLAEQVGENEVLPFPLSEQIDLGVEVLQAAAGRFSEVDVIAHSLGGTTAAKAVLKSGLPGVPTKLVAPPLDNGRQRLEAAPEPDPISPAFTGFNLARVMPMPGGRQVGMTPEFWAEICDSQPLPVAQELFASHPTTIILAGEDTRFRKQQEQIDQLPASDGSSVVTIEGADHYFSRGYRRKVVERLAALVRLEKVT